MFALIPAPGWHGDYVTIYSTHPTLDAARKARERWGKGVRIISGCDREKAGDRIERDSVQAMLYRGDWHVEA